MNDITTKLISIKINADRISWGKGDNKHLLLVKDEILFLVCTGTACSPKDLIFQLNLAKSNIAIICNNLCKEGLISKKKASGNKKEICYCSTPKGEEYLEQKVSVINEMYKNPTEKMLKDLTKAEKILTNMK